MKKSYSYKVGNKLIKKEFNVIPIRYILSILLMLFEFSLVICFLIFIVYIFPYFYIAIILTQIFTLLAIINSNDNPDYKIPWILFVILVPIVGFMAYLMFYSKKLDKKQVKRLKYCYSIGYSYDDYVAKEELYNINKLAYSQAISINNLSSSHLYKNTSFKYFKIGEDMFYELINDLKNAKNYIFMEYFIIEKGILWDEILNILIDKAKNNVDVKLIYDDIGCMNTLPDGYYRKLRKLNIDCVVFSKLRGKANNDFNNRSHRKMTIIDGMFAYTGGVNIADEYANYITRFGHWKDIGVKFSGDAVREYVRLFLIDYNINIRKPLEDIDKYFINYNLESNSFCVPFGDGPRPLYNRRVTKTALLNMLGQARDYVYMTTPYLIVDNELLEAIENASIRGVDVKIITPHIPDKKMIYKITRSHYLRLLKVGVSIYEYKPGFIHQKTYICDDYIGILGTTNLDYRSLVHHFENSIWIYDNDFIYSVKNDIIDTLEKCIVIKEDMLKDNFIRKFFRSIIRIFLPLL